MPSFYKDSGSCMIEMILARSRNNVIGKNGKLPWSQSNDLKWFKSKTMGKRLIVGRKTFLSIPELKGRHLNIATRTHIITNYKVINDLDVFLKRTEKDFVVIGGSEIYKAALPYVDRIYLTDIDCEIKGDSFGPEIDEFEFNEVYSRKDPGEGLGSKNQYNCNYRILERIK